MTTPRVPPALLAALPGVIAGLLFAAATRPSAVCAPGDGLCAWQTGWVLWGLKATAGGALSWLAWRLWTGRGLRRAVPDELETTLHAASALPEAALIAAEIASPTRRDAIRRNLPAASRDAGRPPEGWRTSLEPAPASRDAGRPAEGRRTSLDAAGEPALHAPVLGAPPALTPAGRTRSELAARRAAEAREALLAWRPPEEQESVLPGPVAVPAPDPIPAAAPEAGATRSPTDEAAAAVEAALQALLALQRDERVA